MPTADPITVLHGHTSPETAYVVEDYPYGFRLRCRIRYWIETTKHGQRTVSQTTNPKRPEREIWNTPKASTYSALRVLFTTPDGHVHTDGLYDFAAADAIEAFAQRYAAALTSAYDQDALHRLRTIAARLAERTAARAPEAQP